MNIGVVVPDWGGSPVFGNAKNQSIAQDCNASGIKWIRWDAGNSISNLKTYWINAFPDFRICLLFAGATTGAYPNTDLSTMDPVAWANWALGIWNTNSLTAARVPAIEILNEPWATGWWGTTPITQANAEAYGTLVRQVYTTFHASLGAGCPKILANTFLNGLGPGQPIGPTTWWNWIYARYPDIGNYYDGVIIHPYGGGTSAVNRTVAAQGDRNSVTSAHQYTGKQVWVTEYGWVDGKETPNNIADDIWHYMYTDTEVASNITDFNNWCRDRGYVDSTFIYEYLDEPTPEFYGICYANNPAGTLHGGNYVHKPAPFAALVTQITSQASPVVAYGRPSTELSLTVVHDDKSSDRWGPDEPDGRYIPNDLEFTTSIPGGFKDLTCSLSRGLSVYSDQVPFDDVFVYGAGNDIVWNGYMSRFPFDESSVKPTALGWVNTLTFDTRAREIYVERDMEKFIGEIPKNRRDSLTTGYNIAGQVQIVPPNARIELSFDRLNNVHPPDDLVEVWFDGKGITIAKVYYSGTTWQGGSGTVLTAPWVWAILLNSNDTASVSDIASMLSGTSGYLNASTSAPAKYIMLYLYYGAVYTGDLDARGYLNSVAAYGAHGLTGRGSDPVGFYPSDIISDIVKRWGALLNYTYPGSIEQDTTFVIPSYAQYDPSNGYDMLSAVNAFQLKEWGVYSGGEESYPNRTFFLREPSAARLTWRARRSDGATLSDEGIDAENIVNGVVVNWTGYDGNTYSVGPPSSGCQFTNSVLQDTDPTNLVNSHNLGVKYGHIDLSRKTDLVSATRVGSSWLSRRLGIQRRGTCALTGWVRHPTGALVPVNRVRAGDYLIVEDDPRDNVPRKIINTTYNHGARRNVCDLEYPAFRIDAFIEQLGAQVYGSSAT